MSLQDYTAVRDTADLKQCLTETWLIVPQSIMDEDSDEGSTITSLCQSKGTSLRELAVTNRLFSEPPTFY